MLYKAETKLLINTTIGIEKEWFACRTATGELVNSVQIKGRQFPLIELAVKAIHHTFSQSLAKNGWQPDECLNIHNYHPPTLLTPYLFQTEIDGSMAEGASPPHLLEDVAKGCVQDELLVSQFLFRETIKRIMPDSDLTLINMSTPAYASDRNLPLCLPVDVAEEQRVYCQRLKDDPNYGYRLRRTGTHITVKLADADFAQAVASTRLARPYTPLFIALGANSPYGEGEFRPQHQSWRYETFPRYDTIDVPWLYQSPQYYQLITQALFDRQVIYRLPNQIYTPIRPKAHGGLELRVLDTCNDPEYEQAITLLFGLLIIELAHQPAANDYPYNPRAVRQFRNNEVQAARYGLEAEINLPLRGVWQKMSVRELGRLVMERVDRLVNELNQQQILEPIRAVLGGDPTPAIATIRLYQAYQRAPDGYSAFVVNEVQYKDRQLSLTNASALRRVLNQPRFPQEADLWHLAHFCVPENYPNYSLLQGPTSFQTNFEGCL